MRRVSRYSNGQIRQFEYENHKILNCYYKNLYNEFLNYAQRYFKLF